MSRKIEERISFYKDLLKILSVFVFGIGAGTLGLLYKLKNPVSIPLLFLGAIVETTLLLGMVRLILKIELLIKELNDE